MITFGHTDLSYANQIISKSDSIGPLCPIPDETYSWTYFNNTYDNGQNYGVWFHSPDEKADAFSFSDYCSSLAENSNMARIFNQAENNFITENLIDGIKQAWVGGYYQPIFTRNQTFQGWFWIDQDLKSASVPILYTNWKEGSPRGYNSKTSRQWIAIYGGKSNPNQGNFPGSWNDYQADDLNNFICEVRCPLDENTDTLLLDYNGSIRSTKYGDPVTNGIGVIPVLPSRFEVNLTALFSTIDGNYNTYPLNIGHYKVCNNGDQTYDPAFGPSIRWDSDGEFLVDFESKYGFSYNGFYTRYHLGDIKDGDRLSVQIKIYEDKFYTTYAVNDHMIIYNNLTTFDGSVCGFDYCNGGLYRQKEQFEVPVTAIKYPTLNLDDQGCSIDVQISYSSLTTNVQIWSLEEDLAED